VAGWRWPVTFKVVDEQAAIPYGTVSGMGWVAYDGICGSGFCSQGGWVAGGGGGILWLMKSRSCHGNGVWDFS